MFESRRAYSGNWQVSCKKVSICQRQIGTLALKEVTCVGSWFVLAEGLRLTLWNVDR